jgi:hypothetical protein
VSILLYIVRLYLPVDLGTKHQINTDYVCGTVIHVIQCVASGTLLEPASSKLAGWHAARLPSKALTTMAVEHYAGLAPVVLCMAASRHLIHQRCQADHGSLIKQRERT